MHGTPTDFATPTSGIFPAPVARTRVELLADRRATYLELRRETDADALAESRLALADLDAALRGAL